MIIDGKLLLWIIHWVKWVLKPRFISFEKRETIFVLGKVGEEMMPSKAISKGWLDRDLLLLTRFLGLMRIKV